ncbi:MAG: DUF2061 domain-containing protein [Candidatus Aminicenantaceae bacterium]|jgi:uncharacterized membrane protein
MSRSLKSKLGETHSRTVIKAISWRVIASLTTMTIIYVLTREWVLTLGAGLVEASSKMLFYYAHERAWGKIGWGKQKHPLENIQVTRELEPQDREKIEQQLRDLGYMD